MKGNRISALVFVAILCFGLSACVNESVSEGSNVIDNFETEAPKCPVPNPPAKSNVDVFTNTLDK